MRSYAPYILTRALVNATAKKYRDAVFDYNRYESLLETAIKKGDIFNARGILDSMSKIFLGVDKQQNNIQINNNKDGITIKFGFDNADDESEANYEEIKDE